MSFYLDQLKGGVFIDNRIKLMSANLIGYSGK